MLTHHPSQSLFTNISYYIFRKQFRPLRRNRFVLRLIIHGIAQDEQPDQFQHRYGRGCHVS